jgi:small-conductance mechanosensitive channel
VEDGPDSERVAGVRANGRIVPIVLSRSKRHSGRWVFSRETLANVPELYRARGPSALERRLPPSWREPALGLQRWQWVGLPLAVLVAVLAARLLVFLVGIAGTRLLLRRHRSWGKEVHEELRSPGRLLVSALVFVPLLQALSLPGSVRLVGLRVAGTLGLLALAWTAIRSVRIASHVIERRAVAAATAAGTQPAIRSTRTNVRILQRVASALIATLAIVLALMQFEAVRSIGVPFLASAGVAGIVLGLAAQRTLGSLFAGLQLSIAQPIRIGDEVLVENEFGTVEEITLTYVVVKIWDERRLIVPMSRFLEQPFQNWTKMSSELHGTVTLSADFTVPVPAVRAEVDRLLEGNPRWDGRTKAVHVTDAREHTVELRVLVSAASGGALFDLRAELREHLVAWLVRADNGRYLPRARLDAQSGGFRREPSEEPEAPPESQRRSHPHA